MSVPSPRRAAPVENLRREVEALRRQMRSVTVGATDGPPPRYIQTTVPSTAEVGWVIGRGNLFWYAVEGNTDQVLVYDTTGEVWQIASSQPEEDQEQYASDWLEVAWYGVIVAVEAGAEGYDTVSILVEGYDPTIADRLTYVPMDYGRPGHQTVQSGYGVYRIGPMSLGDFDFSRLEDVTGYLMVGDDRPTTGSLWVYDRALLTGAGAWTPLAAPTAAGQVFAWSGTAWSATPAPTTAGHMLQWNGSAWTLVTSTTPGAHAASHAAAGSDPLTLAQSQVTNLVSDLAGKEAAGTAASAVATHAGITSGVHGISAFGASLIDDANAAAARTTLGLGTAATTAASAYEVAGAVSTHAALTSGVHGISAFGATLVDDASASAARGTLGLSDVAIAAATAQASCLVRWAASGINFDTTRINPTLTVPVASELRLAGTLTATRTITVADKDVSLVPSATGQVLYYDGTSWAARTPAANSLPMPGALTTVTSSTTLTRPAGSTHFVFLLIGGGGGGGGTAGYTVCGGGGGGQGQVAHGCIKLPASLGNVTVTIGTAGSAGSSSGGDGGNGGNSEISVAGGPTVTAAFGAGGKGSTNGGLGGIGGGYDGFDGDAGDFVVTRAGAHGGNGTASGWTMPLLTAVTIGGGTYYVFSDGTQTIDVASCVGGLGGGGEVQRGSGGHGGGDGSNLYDAGTAGTAGVLYYAWVTAAAV